MKTYTVVTSKRAKADIRAFYNCIFYEYKQPDTAIRNRNNIRRTIRKLALLAGTIGANEHIQKMFGAKARHIRYKKMAIIYIVEGNLAYVKRVIPSALIH